MKNLICVAALCAATTAQAQVKIDGTFTASQACDAVISMKKGTNPDNAVVKPGQAYHLIGKNKDDASHYLVEVPNVTPSERWVMVSCGSINGQSVVKTPAPKTPKPTNTPLGTVKEKPASRGFGGQVPYYAFALSWQPTFCEAKGSKAECRIQNAQSFDATHFTIHGLWPQPRRNVFCNVDAATTALDDQHQWQALPVPELSTATKSALDIAMPGTKSDLERHEWIKHGTCYPGIAEAYFKDALRLAAEVNNSAAQKIVASNIGQTISARDLRAKFDESFGKGAGDKVQFECDKQGRFSGITLNLRGDIPGGANLADLLSAGDSARNKCDVGLVDAAG